MKKKAPWNPALLRGLMLVVALGLCLTIRMDIVQYARIAEAGIFGPEEWSEIMDGRRFYWTTQSIMAVTFFYQFATWNWNSDRKKKLPSLVDGMFLSVMTLFWICLHWLIHMGSAARVLWIILLAVLVCGTAYQWRTFWKSKKKNEN